MDIRRLLTAILVCVAACAQLSARPRKPPTLTAEQARDHIGETAKVCGQVASAHYAYQTRGHPTFLNLDRPYPHQEFTAVIWGTDRAQFGEPEKEYRNRHICVSGFISVYRGQPEMILHSPKQIKAK